MVEQEKTLGSIKENISTIEENIKAWILPKSDNSFEEFFQLDVIGTQSISVDSDITEYYVEDNTFYQDNISKKPMVYTIQGEVGELYWYNKDDRQDVIGYVNQKLMPIAEFTPVRSAVGSQIMDKVTKVQQLVEQVDNFYDRLKNLNASATRQELAFLYLKIIVNNRQPIKIKTPWVHMDSAVITSLKVSQPDRTRDKSNISITLKEFRTTQLGTTKFDKNKYMSRAALSLAPEVNQGLTQGMESTIYKVGVGAKELLDVFGG